MPSSPQNSLSVHQASELPRKAIIQVKSGTDLDSEAFFQMVTWDRNKSEKKKEKLTKPKKSWLTKSCSLSWWAEHRKSWSAVDMVYFQDKLKRQCNNREMHRWHTQSHPVSLKRLLPQCLQAMSCQMVWNPWKITIWMFPAQVSLPLWYHKLKKKMCQVMHFLLNIL